MSNNQLKMTTQIASRVFSRSAILDLLSISDIKNSLIYKILLDANYPLKSTTNFVSIFDNIYKAMLKDYRNEYIFKNKVALKLIKARHKYKNVSFVNEFRVGNSLCDIAIFNGTSTAYEIKTDLDNLERLYNQLTDYNLAFDKVYVIAEKAKLSAIQSIIPENVGILELTSHNTLIEQKVAVSNRENISYKTLFYSLRPRDVLSICERYFFYIPTGGASQQRTDCLTLFQKADIKKLHQYFVEYMKFRRLNYIEQSFFSKLPDSIFAILLNLRLTKKQLEKLEVRLTQQIN